MIKHLVSLGILAVIGLMTFSNALHGEFLIDDHAFFEEKLQNIKYLPLHFLPDKNKALHIEGESSDPFYRPLATIVPMLSWLAFKENVVGHHALNLTLFVLAGWGIYLFLSYLGLPYAWALLASALYIIHPINGVVVNYITASIFPVQIILMLLTLYFLKKHPLFAVFLYLLSMMCHEMALMLPFYAFILFAVLSPKQGFKARLLDAWRIVWPLFLFLSIYFFWRMFHSSLDDSILSKIQWYHMNFVQYLATWTMLLSWYLSRLFWPKNIVLIMAHQPLHNGLGIWLVVLALLLALGSYLLWYYRREQWMLLGLLWFFLGFAPFILACFFQPIHGLMIEPHWFLFPVIGFFIFVAGVFMRFEEGNRKWLGRAALIFVMFVCLFFSRWQNWVWADEVRYCTFWLQESPAFVAVNAYLAKAYELRGEDDLARQHYQYILQRGYKSYIAYTNMGLMDLKEGKWDSAETNFLKVIEMDPRASVAVNDLGVIYFKKEDYPTALKYFEKARELNRFEILPYLDISKVQLKLGNVSAAIQALQQALNIVPDNDIALVDLIKIYINQKDDANILKMSRRIARLSRNPYSIRNAGILLAHYGFEAEALSAERKAKNIMGQ